MEVIPEERDVVPKLAETLVRAADPPDGYHSESQLCWIHTSHVKLVPWDWSVLPSTDLKLFLGN